MIDGDIRKLIPDSKRAKPDDDSHTMAEILGWNGCVLEMHKRLLNE